MRLTQAGQTRIKQGGYLVLGQMQIGACTGTVSNCTFQGGRGLVGGVQNVRIWNYVRTSAELNEEMQWPFMGSLQGSLLYYRFDPQQVSSVTGLVTDIGLGLSHRGRLGGPQGAATIGVGTPSITLNYPCGSVYSNVWHFKAPVTYTGDLRKSYNGRLQFSMLAASFSGSPRASRGAVEIVGANGMRISNPISGFATPSIGKWTSYSIIMREDSGWVKEPSNTQPTFMEMRALLRNVTAIKIRGDAWVYSASGAGQESVYINNVSLYRASAAR